MAIALLAKFDVILLDLPTSLTLRNAFNRRFRLLHVFPGQRNLRASKRVNQVTMR